MDLPQLRHHFFSLNFDARISLFFDLGLSDELGAFTSTDVSVQVVKLGSLFNFVALAGSAGAVIEAAGAEKRFDILRKAPGFWGIVTDNAISTSIFDKMICSSLSLNLVPSSSILSILALAQNSCFRQSPTPALVEGSLFNIFPRRSFNSFDKTSPSYGTSAFAIMSNTSEGIKEKNGNIPVVKMYRQTPAAHKSQAYPENPLDSVLHISGDQKHQVPSVFFKMPVLYLDDIVNAASLSRFDRCVGLPVSFSILMLSSLSSKSDRKSSTELSSRAVSMYDSRAFSSSNM
mmetsp:Transcript_25069/g.45158  ORF Transcript_25069/g.45158 Transcript_25069/m.45158 type:complete len:289 (+) Transcript_25069:94-960(+)